jgi:hypothetical protein
MDLGGTAQLGPELAGARMEPPQFGGRDARVESIPQELVSEVVVTPVGELERVQERVCHQLRERRVEIADLTVEHTCQHLRDEAAADHGARPGDLPGIVGQP